MVADSRQYEFTDDGQQKLTSDSRVCPICHMIVNGDVMQCPRDGTALDDFGSAELLFEGRYRILSVIASGGMGTIYKGVQKSLNKVVAIKMLKTQDSAASTFARFKQEAKAASLLKHHNIIQVFDFGATTDGQPYMVMDFVEGTDLGTLIKTEKQLHPYEALQIFLQVADAMQHAHTTGVMHRDLKPSNIMLTNLSGLPEVKIVDFGIAKFLKGHNETQALTKTGDIFGSPYYMSPEQTVNKDVDQRSDIYSLGCIMYETLSGTVPIAGKTAFETLMKHGSEKATPLSARCPKNFVSDDLQRVVMKCLEKEPSKRFQSMVDLKDALAATPEGKGKRSPSLLKGNNLKLAIGVGAALLTAAVVGTVFFFVNTAQPSTNAATVELQLQQKIAERAKLDTDFSVDPTKAGETMGSDAEQSNDLPEAQRPILLLNRRDALIEDFVAQNPKATSIILKNCSISEAGIKALKKLKLAYLVLIEDGSRSSEAPRLTDEVVTAIIANQPYLQLLTLQNLDVSDDVLAPIDKLRYLKVLRLDNLDRMTGNGLNKLPKSLESLALIKNHYIPPAEISAVANLQPLKTLILDASLVNDSALTKLTVLKNLTELNLDHCAVTDDTLSIIPKFKNLTTLSLRGTFISPPGLDKLAPMTRLRQLDITDVNIRRIEVDKFAQKMAWCTVHPSMTKTDGFTQGTVAPDIPDH
ncbi:MAG TPA: protein kinase [Oculatellaceae cyanobacterium]